MIANRKVIALLPMKAHSERVPNKNIRPFLAEPLYFRIMHALSNTDVVDEIVINTDSEQISREAPKHFEDVRIIERPEVLRGDEVSMNRIVEFDLENTDADIYLQTHSTNPLITSTTISEALETFIRNADEYDSLFTVNKFQSRFYDNSSTPINHDPNELIRTQDLDPIYEENSCIYIFTKASFQATSARIGSQPFMFETPRVESVDIDDQETWRLAEIIASGLAR